MMCLQFTDVMARYLFRQPMQGTQGLMASLLPVVVVMSLAHIQRVKAHIKFTLVYERMPRVVQLIMDVAVLCVSIALWIIVGWFAVVVIVNQSQTGHYFTMRTPAWWHRVLIPMGILFLCPALASDVMQALRGLRDLRKGRRADA